MFVLNIYQLEMWAYVSANSYSIIMWYNAHLSWNLLQTYHWNNMTPVWVGYPGNERLYLQLNLDLRGEFVRQHDYVYTILWRYETQ